MDGLMLGSAIAQAAQNVNQWKMGLHQSIEDDTQKRILAGQSPYDATVGAYQSHGVPVHQDYLDTLSKEPTERFAHWGTTAAYNQGNTYLKNGGTPEGAELLDQNRPGNPNAPDLTGLPAMTPPAVTVGAGHDRASDYRADQGLYGRIYGADAAYQRGVDVEGMRGQNLQDITRQRYDLQQQDPLNAAKIAGAISGQTGQDFSQIYNGPIAAAMRAAGRPVPAFMDQSPPMPNVKEGILSSHYQNQDQNTADRTSALTSHWADLLAHSDEALHDYNSRFYDGLKEKEREANNSFNANIYGVDTRNMLFRDRLQQQQLTGANALHVGIIKTQLKGQEDVANNFLSTPEQKTKAEKEIKRLNGLFDQYIDPANNLQAPGWQQGQQGGAGAQQGAPTMGVPPAPVNTTPLTVNPIPRPQMAQPGARRGQPGPGYLPPGALGGANVPPGSAVNAPARHAPDPHPYVVNAGGSSAPTGIASPPEAFYAANHKSGLSRAQLTTLWYQQQAQSRHVGGGFFKGGYGQGRQ